jgi:hypothetical protein
MIQLSERRLLFPSLFSLPVRRLFAYRISSNIRNVAKRDNAENRGQRLKYRGRWHLLQTRRASLKSPYSKQQNVIEHQRPYENTCPAWFLVVGRLRVSHVG